jgi:transposase-like protein
MVTCPTCVRRPTKRDGRDHRSRQRYACRPCGRDFTATSTSIFSGYRWPADVILAAVRWYVSYPLSARQVTELLAERGIDVSPRTVLNWTQTFGPQLAVAARVHRRGSAGGGMWTRSSCSVAARSGISIGPSTSTAR